MPALPLLIAEEDAAGGVVIPDGYETLSAHISEASARRAADTQPLAVALLSYVTGSNRTRYLVLARG